ncbi:MAG: hypothetical protein U9P10_15045 [Thermodesulfobacteriota bacterium]|nr:hypothetical protein [Thermodesulfobacteriota bacterium]
MYWNPSSQCCECSWKNSWNAAMSLFMSSRLAGVMYQEVWWFRETWVLYVNIRGMISR